MSWHAHLFFPGWSFGGCFEKGKLFIRLVGYIALALSAKNQAFQLLQLKFQGFKLFAQRLDGCLRFSL